MQTKLNDIDRRVLGVLMEKEMSQPDYYPMTLNAVVAACNQKQNRDPLMQLDEVAVAASLASLQEQGLVTTMFPAQSGRVKRHRHEVEQVYGWLKPQRAVMTELLLRGPQTVGELRTRCQRFVRFADLEAVSQVLDELNRREPPIVRAMAREPGRTAIRFRHLLDSEGAADQQTPTPIPDTTATGDDRQPTSDVQVEIKALRQELADLRERVSAIEAHKD